MFGALTSLIPGGKILGGALGIAGGLLSNSMERGAVGDAYAAGRTIMPDQFREAFGLAGRLGERELNQFKRFNLEQQTQKESARLAELRAPSIDQARARLQSQLLNRGRLGVGIGGGRSGGMFNPETFAQEEAILQAQLGDIGVARSFAIGEQQRHLSNARGLFNIGSPLVETPNPRLAAMQAAPGMNLAQGTRGFFSGLGQSIAGGGFFGGGGGGGNTMLNPRGGV